MTAARALGLSRTESARFSMLMAIPVIVAFALVSVIELARAETAGASLVDGLIVAGLSFVAALAAIAVLMKLVERVGFLPFVAYRVLLDLLAIGLANAATNNAVLTSGTAVVVLNPDHASVLARAGLTRREIAAELCRRCVMSPEQQLRWMPSLVGPDPQPRPAFTDPSQILILMAGGNGLYSMVMPSWSTGTHKNSPSSVEVELAFSCEIPGPAGQGVS